MRKVIVKTLGGVDEYGQMLNEILEEKEIEMTFKLYYHTATDDVRYQDCQYSGLTKAALTDKDIVSIDEKDYKVCFVNPFGRLNQVFLNEI